MRRKLIQLEREGKSPDFVFLDYLQNVPFTASVSGGVTQTNVIDNFVIGFKSIVCDFGANPVILSQITEGKDGAEPHLRDSQSTEMKAQVLLYILRKKITTAAEVERAAFQYEGTRYDEIISGVNQRSLAVELRVTKSTRNSIGSVEAVFNQPRYSFMSKEFLLAVEKDKDLKTAVPMLRRATMEDVHKAQRRAIGVDALIKELARSSARA
jgi:hypothetical protein